MNILEKRFAPTPLYLLDTDEKDNRMFIKREDLIPYSFGGNKVRIGIEYLRDMKAKGCDHLVAYGNARSNLCRVLSNLCAGLGVPITILSPADDNGQRRPAFNGRICVALGAQIVPCLKTNVAESIDKVFAGIRRGGRKPYYIYGDRFGKGNESVPTAAYANMYMEIAAQEEAMRVAFDAVFLAVGTGVTQAGLLCGQAMAGEAARGWRVIGISTARETMRARSYIQAHVNAYMEERIGEAPTECIEVHDDFRESYGQYGRVVENCIREVMMRYGVPLDGTYTGKAFYGMRELIHHWGWQGRDLLFIHTGGMPLFFDAAEKWEKV